MGTLEFKRETAIRAMAADQICAVMIQNESAPPAYMFPPQATSASENGPLPRVITYRFPIGIMQCWFFDSNPQSTGSRSKSFLCDGAPQEFYDLVDDIWTSML